MIFKDLFFIALQHVKHAQTPHVKKTTANAQMTLIQNKLHKSNTRNLTRNMIAYHLQFPRKKKERIALAHKMKIYHYILTSFTRVKIHTFSV